MLNIKSVPIEQLKVACFMKVNKDFAISHEGMDYINEMLSAQLIGYVYSASKESGIIDVHVRRPTFIEWLFRRTRTIKQHYTIRHLIKADQLPPNIATLPIIEFGKPNDV